MRLTALTNNSGGASAPAAPETVRSLGRGAGVDVTGTTSETASATLAIAAGALAAGDVVRVRVWFRRTASGINNATVRVRLGATQLGSLLFISSNLTGWFDLDIYVGSVDGSGVGQRVCGVSGQSNAASTVAPVTSTEDLTAGGTLSMNVTLLDATDTVCVQAYSAEVIKAAAA